MGLFSFLTENGRGSLAVLAREKLTYEVGNNLMKICSSVQVMYLFFVKFIFLLLYLALPSIHSVSVVFDLIFL